MKLQAKTMLIIAATWVIICLVIFADAKLIISRNYQYLEDQQMLHDVEDTERAFDKMLFTLSLYTQSFSQWDGAYSFMQTKNRKFINSNFVPGTYTSSQINFFLFFDLSGRLFYGQAYDLAQNKMIPTPGSLLDYLAHHLQFVTHNKQLSGVYGIFNIKDGLIAMSSQPVLTSDGKGPAKGSLLMGYYLTDKHFKSLSELVGMHLKYIPLNELSTQKPAFFSAIKLALKGTPAKIILNEHLAYVFMPLKDINKKPVGILQIEMPRLVYQQGLSTIYHYIFIVVILGFVVMFLLWCLLKLFVLNRLININNQILEINHENDFEKQLSTVGKDELSEMVSCINNMMSMISYSQNRLRYLASHDSLTQLPNRDLFYIALSKELKKAEILNQQVGVMFLDLDQFKMVNDTYGHGIGDKLLQHAVARIKNVIREDDMLARQSGDEFLLYISNINDKKQISLIAKKLIVAVSQPFSIDHFSIEISVSIGISLFPENGQTIEELLRKADQAMYMIKTKSKNDYQFYSEVVFESE